MLNKLSVVYDNRSISLENITTLAILGENGVGKTAFLERIALTNEDNIPTILNLTSSPPWKGRGFPSQGAHRSHHRFGATSLIWWAVEWLREPLPLSIGVSLTKGTFIAEL